MSDGVPPVGELAGVGVEGDGAFRVVVLESFGLREPKGELGWRVVGQMLLDVLMRDYGDLAHSIKFIMKHDKTKLINICLLIKDLQPSLK